MAAVPHGQSGVVQDVSATHRALHVESRPVENGRFGQFSWSGVTANQTGAGIYVVTFHWGLGERFRTAVVRSVVVTIDQTTAPAANRFCSVFLQVFRNTDNGWAGGVSQDATGNNNKLRTTYGSSMARIDVSNGGNLSLSPATGSGDAVNYGTVPFNFPPTANVNVVPATELIHLSHPLVLVPASAFSLGVNASGAVGTWRLGATICWAETDRY